MTEYDKTNRGSIWKNDKKDKDSHPDFTGSLNVDGTEYWVSAWKRKEGASPKAPALSFSVKPKEDRRQEPPSRAAPRPAGRAPARGELNNDFSDDVPF